MTKQLWISYAWADNQDKDIDFIANTLDAAGLQTIFDRRVLIPGQRLWDQIGGFISDPTKVDAFSFIVTPNSLVSEPCKEELSYAIQRVMGERGGDFPLIGLMHRVRASDMPMPLKVRLCVPLSGPNWVNEVVAGVNKQAPSYKPENLLPYVVKKHNTASGCLIQITPRMEHVSPVQIAVDLDQKQSGNVELVFPAPASVIPGSNGFLSINSSNRLEVPTTLSDGTAVNLWQMDNEASPSQSYWIMCKSPPPRIWFGNPQKGLALLQIQ